MKNRGISLIVLVITIIVIIILAGSVILSLSNNNPIAQATESTFKSNIGAYNSELSMTMTSLYLSNTAFDATAFNVPAWDGVSATTGTIKQYITSMSDADAKKFEIQNGKLVYIGADSSETTWNAAINVTKEAPLFTKTKPQVSDVNKYKTPYIPAGFTYKEGKWDSGLVIQDVSGNEFVWVPVDGTNVTFTKWCAIESSYTITTDDTLPTGISDETAQITNYGGFYIARYEAGNSSGTLVSKKAVQPWGGMVYADSKLKADTMYNTASVKSGLTTGRQWDALMKWIQNSGVSVSDSRTWGNHPDSLTPANISGFAAKQVTGYSEIWKAKNIYDIAGNSWEWTNEKNGATNGIVRSGDFDNSGASCPASIRRVYGTTETNTHVAFRVSLYIL